MDIDKHQEKCLTFCTYPSTEAGNIEELYYLAGLLAEEVGEVLGKINKPYRKGQRYLTDDQHNELAKELGDCYWALGQLCRVVGIRPSMILEMNVQKLTDRQERGVIDVGEGDNR